MYLPLHYYVYSYLREDNTPYYIGKGIRDRAWKKGTTEVQPPRDLTRIVIVEEGLTELGALAIERRLIRWYGRKDTGTGILRNQTDGGDGGPGSKKGSTKSEETKKKIALSVALTKSLHTVEEKKRISENISRAKKGCILSPKAIAKIVAKTTGQKRSEESKQKMRKPRSEAAKLNMRGPKSPEHAAKIRRAPLKISRNAEI